MSIQFNGNDKLITLSSNLLDVNILWSEWVNWLLIGDNSKYPVALNQVGGDTINEDAGTFIPLYYFLMNGWRIKPQEANHTLSVTNGILLVLGGGDPFMNTIGAYTVRINYQQPVQAITVSTGGGSSLTKQQIRDALALSLSDGTNILADSVDNILNRLDLKTNYI